ncbi:MAG: NAD(P)H-dependent oxidoreductase subunit E [Thermoleophilia bacterium]
MATDMAGLPGALMPILHAVLEEFGHIGADDPATIADALNLAEAEVHGVVSFYTDFRRTPPAPVRLRICRGEACQAVGAEELVAHAVAAHGCRVGGRTDDGRVELEQVFCFGNCALGPTVAVNDTLTGRVHPERLDALLAGEGR